MNDFSFNPAIRRIVLLADDAERYAQDHHDRFLEVLARARANRDMDRLLVLNTPRRYGRPLFNRILSTILP